MTCPNCIIEMEQITRRFGPLGGKRIIFQCPKFGYNEMKSSQRYYNMQDFDRFDNIKNAINNNELNHFNSCDSDK